MARKSSNAGLNSQRFAFMLGAAGQGFSANRTLAALRDAGLGIGRTLGLKLFKAAKAVVDQRASAAGLDWGNPIPDDFATPWPSKNKTGYGVVVKINATNHVTGEEIEVYHTTYTDELITPGQAIANAIDAYSEPKYADEFAMNYGAVNNVVQYQPEAA